MSPVVHTHSRKKLVLRAETAADLMTPNPVSINDTATVTEAVALLTDRGFSAAPVIDQAGQPVGVVSRSDILVHDRERAAGTPAAAGGGAAAESAAGDPTPVRDIMTPAVFSVTPDTPAASVVEQMLELNVHHLFVVDAAGVLVGVISTLDVLRRLRR